MGEETRLYAAMAGVSRSAGIDPATLGYTAAKPKRTRSKKTVAPKRRSFLAPLKAFLLSGVSLPALVVSMPPRRPE